MFCPNCGKEVKSYTGICETCGTNVAQNPIGPANAGGGAEPPKKAGGNKKLLIILPIVAVVVLAVVVGILNAAAISNAIKKATLSPEAYCQYVLQKNFAESNATAELYDTFFYQRLQNRRNESSSGEIALQLSDDAVDWLEDKSGSDLEAFADLRLNYDQQIKDDQAALELKLNSGKNSIVSGELIFDMEEKAVYGIVPQINKDYAKIDLESVLDADELEELETVLAAADKMVESYPDPKTVREMQERYFNAIITELDDVKESSEKLTVDGIKQSFTVLTIRLDEDQLSRMMTSLCEEVAGDDALKDTVIAMVDSLNITGEDMDGEEIWEEIKEGLENFADEAEDLDLQGAEYEIELYVSGKGKIQGIRFNFEDGDSDASGSVYFAYVTKGNAIAMEGSIEYGYAGNSEEVTFSGNGTLSMGKLNADMQISGPTDLDFRLENLDLAGVKKGHIGGDLVIELKQFKSALSSIGLKDLKDQALTVRLDVSDKSGLFEISLSEDKDVFVSFSISGKRGSAGKIDIPADSKCVEITDEEEMQEYVDDCDLEELTDTLEDMGLDDLAYAVTSTASNAGSTMNYINNSKVAADTQLADSVHTAVLTGMMDPEIVNRKEYNEDYAALMTPVDITQYTGTEEENVILWGAAQILGVEDLHELSDMLKSSGATGRIFVTITAPNRVEVVLEGTDDGHGSEITIN